MHRPANDLPVFGAFGTVAGAVGVGWLSYLRFLHPAMTRDLRGAATPVTWASAASAAGRAVDLSVAAWFDVTGVRAHQDVHPAGIDDEPAEGQDAGPLVATLVRALTGGRGLVDVAEWDGYEPRPRDQGSEGVLTVHSRGYRHRRLAVADLADLVSDVGDGAPQLVANMVWRPGHWFVTADIDCMSTYLGSSLAPADLLTPGLERVEVGPADPVS